MSFAIFVVMNKISPFDLLIEQLEQIPSIGRKSASKIAYALVVENKILALNIAHCIEDAVNKTSRCDICNGISEGSVCNICKDEVRLYSGILCMVASARDILIIEESGVFHGVYFAIEDINNVDFSKLIINITKFKVREILFAFTPSLASDTMMIYIEDKLHNNNLKFSKIAQGVPTGVGLDNVDKLSLTKAIESRIKI